MHRKDQAALFDALTEIQRIEKEIWGHTLDAAIMRYMAATRITTDRASQVSSIADTLGHSPSTIHAHLTRLSGNAGRASSNADGAVERVDGGYGETALGMQLNERMFERISTVLAQYLRRFS